jgi:Fe2+ transport system protein FeoA
MTFSQVEIGKKYKLVNYGESSKLLRKKCLSLGLLKGTLFKIIRVAPLGDPVQINVRGYEITIRREDFENLEIVEVNV